MVLLTFLLYLSKMLLVAVLLLLFFFAVEGVLAVASVAADPGVHILVGGFTYWIAE
jgi:hypothetical protein